MMLVKNEHIKSLASHGVKVVDSDTHEQIPLTEEWYEETMKKLESDRWAKAYVFEIDINLDFIGDKFLMVLWKDGNVDSGSEAGIMKILESR